MRRLVAFLSVPVVLGSLAWMGLSGWADEPKKDDKDPNVAEKEAGAAMPADVVDDAALAQALADWGRDHKSPVAIALAGRILESAGSRALEWKGETKLAGEEVDASAKQPKEAKAPAVNALLDEARKATKSEPEKAAVEYVAKMETGATAKGSVRGPGVGAWCVWGGHYMTFTDTFRGGELAYISVDGDGSTDLDLYVFDEFGNLIASDRSYGDYCAVSWYPAWTGPFRIEVHNLGGISNAYIITTN